MKSDVLLLTSLVTTVFIMILDHMFIHNHLTLVQPLSDQFFDSTDMKIIEKELDKEIKKEEKLIEKMKENGDKKKKKKSEEINLNNDEIYNEQMYDNYPEEYNDQQENPYYEEDNYYQPQHKPERLRLRTQSRHYAFSEPQIDQMGSIMAYNE
jgi:Skp family chaperone for outer membrane proteins